MFRSVKIRIAKFKPVTPPKADPRAVEVEYTAAELVGEAPRRITFTGTTGDPDPIHLPLRDRRFQVIAEPYGARPGEYDGTFAHRIAEESDAERMV